MPGRKKTNQKSGTGNQSAAPASIDLFPEEPAASEDSETESARIAFRWTRHHVDMLKQVADKIGIPYQTYIKNVLYRQATQDLKDFADDSPKRK